MTGHIRIRGKSYVAIINIPPIDGKREHKWVPIGYVADMTKKQAEKELEKILLEYDLKYANFYSVTPEKRNLVNIRFVDWIREYVKTKENSLSPNVYWNYCRRVDEIEKYPLFTNIKLVDIKAQDLISYYNYKRSQGLKDTSIKKISNIIHPAIRNAYQMDIIPKDITQAVPHFHESHPPIHYFDKQDLDKFLEVIKGHKNELAFKIACYYGFRRSEIIGLKWDAIDFEQKTITVKHKVTICRRKIWLSDKLKTESSFRTLPLIPQIEQDLLLRKKINDTNRELYASSYDQRYKDYVFVDELGKLLFPDNLTHQFQLVVKKNNLKHIRFHDLRHSCASLLLSSGVHMKQIQEWLGHADFSTTANIYSHLDFSSKIESAKKISDSFNGQYVDKHDQEIAEQSENGFAPPTHDPYKNKRDAEKSAMKYTIQKPKEPQLTEEDYEEFMEFMEWKKMHKKQHDEEM